MDKGGEGEKPKVVVDASVAVKWVIPGEPWEEQAVALKDMVVSGEVEAYAPQLIMYEVASVILKAVLRGILKPSRGAEALRAFKDLGISIQAFDWDCAAEVLAAALETGLTIYDSVYLHLSRRLNCRLVTADGELEEKGRNVAEIVLLGDLKLQR